MIWREVGMGRWPSATRVSGGGSSRRSTPSFRCRCGLSGRKSGNFGDTIFSSFQLILTFGCVVAFNQSDEIKSVKKIIERFHVSCKGGFSCEDISRQQCTGSLLEFLLLPALPSSLQWPASGPSECEIKYKISVQILIK